MKKSRIKETTEKKEKAAAGGMKHTSRPDYDNLEKFYNDCIKKIVIKDDSQLCAGDWDKEYAEVPRTEIWIYPEPLYRSPRK